MKASTTSAKAQTGQTEEQPQAVAGVNADTCPHPLRHQETALTSPEPAQDDSPRAKPPTNTPDPKQARRDVARHQRGRSDPLRPSLKRKTG